MANNQKCTLARPGSSRSGSLVVAQSSAYAPIGKLDSTVVAGGVTAGTSPFETIDIDEVKEFYLLTPEEDKAALLRRESKRSSTTVFVGPFIRYGLITAKGDEVDYAELNMRLHRRLSVATAPQL